MRKTGAALASYVAKYISKGFAYRQPQDKGMRLYSVIGGSRACSSRFSFYSLKVFVWRKRWPCGRLLGQVLLMLWLFRAVIRPEPLTYDDLPSFFGKRWAWRYRDNIMAMNPVLTADQLALFCKKDNAL